MAKLVQVIRKLSVSIQRRIQEKGLYRISLELSDKSTKVKYYRGDFSNGVFDTTHCETIKTVKGTGHP